MGERVTLLENGREYRGRVLDLSLEEAIAYIDDDELVEITDRLERMPRDPGRQE